MIPANYNLQEAYRGDSYGPLTFRFKDESGNYIDFRGARVDLQVRNKRFKDVIVVSWSTADESMEVFNDAIILKQIPGENMKIPPGVYMYDLQVKQNNVTKTYLKGTFTVLEDITEI